MVDNEHANQGSQYSSVAMYTLVVHNVAFYQLGAADDFACLLSTFFIVYNAVLSVYVSLCVCVCVCVEPTLCTTSTVQS